MPPGGVTKGLPTTHPKAPGVPPERPGGEQMQAGSRGAHNLIHTWWGFGFVFYVSYTSKRPENFLAEYKRREDDSP